MNDLKQQIQVLRDNDNLTYGGLITLNNIENETNRLEERIISLEDKINRAKNCLVCVAIGDPVEVCENTLKILEDLE